VKIGVSSACNRMDAREWFRAHTGHILFTTGDRVTVPVRPHRVEHVYGGNDTTQLWPVGVLPAPGPAVQVVVHAHAVPAPCTDGEPAHPMHRMLYVDMVTCRMLYGDMSCTTVAWRTTCNISVYAKCTHSILLPGRTCEDECSSGQGWTLGNIWQGANSTAQDTCMCALCLQCRTNAGCSVARHPLRVAASCRGRSPSPSAGLGGVTVRVLPHKLLAVGKRDDSVACARRRR
jgi:hypothetical protein